MAPVHIIIIIIFIITHIVGVLGGGPHMCTGPGLPPIAPNRVGYLPVTCPANAGLKPFYISFVIYFLYSFENKLRFS
jgi:hypothetical protein